MSAMHSYVQDLHEKVGNHARNYALTHTDVTTERDKFMLIQRCVSGYNGHVSSFITSALQQSTVHLTWDATDHRRVKTTMRKYIITRTNE